MVEVIYQIAIHACACTICWYLGKICYWLEQYNNRLDNQIKQLEEKIEIQRQLKLDIHNADGLYHSEFIPELDNILWRNGITKKEA